MPIDVEKHFGHPVPDAQDSIYRMLRIGTKQSRKTIKILRDNINKLEKLRGKSA